MTTVVNPGSGEVSVFNRDGVAITSLTANHTTTTTVGPLAGTTVCLVTDATPSDFTSVCLVQLSSAFEIGDIVELQRVGGGPAGDVHDSNGTYITGYNSIRLRKIVSGTSELWLALRGA
jgi:hypothetical protein